MPTEQENEQNHQDILSNLDKSKPGVYKVADWLNTKGYTVTVPPMNAIQSTYAERMKYVDGGDLFIHQRVEVKVRGIDFTCADDYPYKDGVYVCAQHSFDNAVPKPYAYILLNRAKTHAAIVMGSFHKQWTAKEVQDSRYRDFIQKTYVCPLSAVYFSQM
jgi:hypothetical protein